MSQTRFLKSMITPTLVEPTENHEAGVASGVWSTQDQLEARRGGVWPEAGVTNPDTLIENNFATIVYEGNGSTQTITTGLDLANKGGLVWIKNRDAADSNVLIDTVRGVTKVLHSDTDAAEATDADTVTGFSSTGFDLGADVKVNTNNESYVAWVFKKAPKFFDVLTYTGTGSAQNISHNLGSVPGMIWVKNLDDTDDWAMYHKFADGSAPEDKYFSLNTNDSVSDSAEYWNDTAPTSSVFTVGTNESTNINGENYVAYLFGHETDADSMIRMDLLTGNNSNSNNQYDIGWEIQWHMGWEQTGNSHKLVVDNIRGLPTFSYFIDGATVLNSPYLRVNGPAQDEKSNEQLLWPQTVGFNTGTAGKGLNYGSRTYCSVAIRRPNMKTHTDATEVFAMDTRGSTGDGLAPSFRSTFPIDFGLNIAASKEVSTRLLHSSTHDFNTSAEHHNQTNRGMDYNNGFIDFTSVVATNVAYMFKRAKGFLDIVAYEGTGSARTEAHALSVAPELMFIKNRENNQSWAAYHGDNTNYLVPNTTAASVDDNAYWNDTSPTSSVFTIGTATSVNDNGSFFIAYLFATLAGVSKVGSVTHSGSSTDVDCGFASGARFILIKRTDATSAWYSFSTLRGIIAGNDPYYDLSDNASEVTNTDYVDPLASGFQISGNFPDGDYIFLAMA